jgi:hypothetical protein
MTNAEGQVCYCILPTALCLLFTTHAVSCTERFSQHASRHFFMVYF